MPGAAGIELPATLGTNGVAIKIFADGQLPPAGAAQNGKRIELFLRPDDRRVPGKIGVALMTREPFAAAFELQRDDVVWTGVMTAPRFRVDIDAIDLNAVNGARHGTVRSRGQISTSADPTIQHPIMTMNPVLNEPVR